MFIILLSLIAQQHLLNAKLLFMICPTDFVEYPIYQKYGEHSYFFTSLGISSPLDTVIFNQIVEVIDKNDIEEVIYVLSENNQIILDAVNNQKFINISGLKKHYKTVSQVRKMTKDMWSSYNPHILFLSYYLNDKMNELRCQLQSTSNKDVKVFAKIYSEAYAGFRDIYPNLTLLNPIRIN